MATYKVIQDVEAEDKLIGFLTFRQFLYLVIASLGAFLTYGFFQLAPFLALIPLPFVVIFAVLGIWHREDQPIETYLLAFLNFVLKPRKRVWNPDGVIHNVTITAPKQAPARVLPSPDETKGQLKNLAQIIDTRGWSSKRPELQEPTGGYRLNKDDRLVLPDQAYYQEPIDIHEGDDIFAASAISQKMTELASSSAKQTRATAIAKMKNAISNQPAPTQVASTETTPEESAATIDKDVVNKSEIAPEPKPAPKTNVDSKPPVPDDILSLAHSELPIDQIAKKANRGSNEMNEDEEVSLR